MLTATSSFFRSGRVPALLMCLGLLQMGPAAQAQGFAPTAAYSTSTIRGPYDVKLGDVNGDGVLDIVTAETEMGVGVLLGLAGGVFGSVTNYRVSTATGSSAGSGNIALGDVTGDGRLDIVATSLAASSVVVVLPGLTGGGFGPFVHHAVTPGDGPRGLALGDMNGDGRLDIVTANYYGNSVGVLLAQAGGGFAAPASYALAPTGSPEGVALGDVNGDGRLDIATTCAIGSGAGYGAAVMLALAGGGYGLPTVYNVANFPPRNVALGDVTGDGRLDLVVAGVNNSMVGVLPGLAVGFGAINAYNTGGGGLGLMLGDADNDGRLDIIVSNTNTQVVGILAAQAGGGFAPLATYSVDVNSANGGNNRPYAVALGDVDGDGHTDMVAANALASEAVVLLAVRPLPTVTGFNPPTGGTGSALTLTGRDLTGTLLIRFSGAANTTVSSGFVVNPAGTQISNVVVPRGAVSGPITVQKAAGAATTVANYTVQGPTATATPDAGAAIQLSPNPAHATCTLSGLPPTATPATATLHNALGQLVRTVALAPTGGQAEVSVAGLPAGVYAVRVQAGGLAVVRRLVVE